MKQNKLLDYEELKDFIIDERRFLSNMGNIKDEALNYESKKTLVISDLESVNIEDLEVYEEEGLTDEDKPFKYKYFELDKQKYRIPNTVLEGIKAIVMMNPEVKAIKVLKSGDGLKTKYQVIPN